MPCPPADVVIVDLLRNHLAWRPYYKDRHLGRMEDAVGYAPHNPSVQAGASVGGNENKVNISVFRIGNERCCDLSYKDFTFNLFTVL